MTNQYRVTEIDYERADRYRRGFFIYSGISAFCTAVGVVHIAAGDVLFAIPALALAAPAAMGAYAMILARAVVLTGQQMGGFAALRWLGGWRSVMFSRRVPEIYPPQSN